jgi:hypothetical protein
MQNNGFTNKIGKVVPMSFVLCSSKEASVLISVELLMKCGLINIGEANDSISRNPAPLLAFTTYIYSYYFISKGIPFLFFQCGISDRAHHPPNNCC